MQQAELQIKQQEVQRKAAKDQADAQIEQAKLQLQAQENMQDAQMDQAELALKIGSRNRLATNAREHHG